VCRLVEKKGLEILIEACRRLRDRHVNFQTWIVGAGWLQAKLEAQIRACGLDPDVRLLGPHAQREVLARYQSSHLFVLPCVVGSDGNREGLPVSIVEALACGLPVVTTPVTGIPEVVRHGHNGLLVPEQDAAALADAIEAVIRDPALYERLRANTRASVESTFDFKQTTAELARLFAASTTSEAV
jgi:glycosyltransferase involved in cell wall biosynthesis